MTPCPACLQEAEMRLYRRELRADTPTLMKISALELMSKECRCAPLGFLVKGPHRKTVK